MVYIKGSSQGGPRPLPYTPGMSGTGAQPLPYTPRSAGVGALDGATPMGGREITQDGGEPSWWDRFKDNFGKAFFAQQLGGSQPTMGVLPVLPGSGEPVNLGELDFIRSRPSGGATGELTPGTQYNPLRPSTVQETAQDQPQVSTLEELLALAEMYRPTADYSGYRDEMQRRADAIANSLAKMYADYEQAAKANVGRVQDIYEGVRKGTGDIYGSAAQTVEEAARTANRQEADQLARLGIEAAAPLVTAPAAASTARALNALAQGRATGESFATRAGGIGGEFASQMQQVAQQQGVEQSQAMYNALQRLLADSMQQEMAAGADFDPLATALQIQKIEQGLTPGGPDPFDVEQADLKVFNDAYERNMERYVGATGTEREQKAYDATMREAATGQFGPRLQQQAINEGYGVQ